MMEGYETLFRCDLRGAIVFGKVSTWWIFGDYMLNVGAIVSNCMHQVCGWCYSSNTERVEILIEGGLEL